MTRLLLPSFLVLLPLCCGSWGFAVHRHINGAAVDALEEPLRGWLGPHRSWLSEHSVDADKRKRMVERRWRHSIHGVASLWTTAWVEAGQPDLATALQPEPKGLLRWWRRLKSSR